MNASKPSRVKREGGAKVRSGWGKKGRVRPINYARGKKRGATTVGGEGKSEEGRIVGSRDINGGGCAEGGGSLFTGFSDPPLLETTLHWPALSSRSLISATKFHPTPPLSPEQRVNSRARGVPGRGLSIRSSCFYRGKILGIVQRTRENDTFFRL